MTWARRQSHSLDATGRRRRSPGDRGIMLIECLAYFALWFVVVGFAMSLFYHAMIRTTQLHRTADRIIAVLHAGEQWRADLRRATGPPLYDQVTDGPEQVFLIPIGRGEVGYYFTGTNVLRRSGRDASWAEVMSGVNGFELVRETNGPVTAWRWELELKPVSPSARVRPLFTFLGVAPTATVIPGGGNGERLEAVPLRDDGDEADDGTPSDHDD
jgi:hypothetical protein